MQPLRFESTMPGAKLDLVIEPAFGALKCKLVDAGTNHVALFVTTSFKQLIAGLTADLKAHAKHKGASVAVRFTWTDTESGFNFHLTPKDAESLLATLKENCRV